ncbi:MAG: carboxypeptidase regulatory-like domain-containing protein [Planctomycetaceae bacterium]
MPLRHFTFLLAGCCCCLCGAGAGDERPGAPGGVVEGRIVYAADPARPWRFQRYYVKQPKAGGLAEAVVALRGRELNSVPSPSTEDRTHTIDQFNFQFIPETTAIRAGESITFSNSDLSTHNVKSTAGIATFNFNLEADDEHTQRFDRAGGMSSPVTLGCVYHGGMRAWVYVFDHPFFTVTGEDGRFRFEHVPPGRYTLELVHPAGQLRWKDTIVVAAGEAVTLDVRLSPDHKTLQ